MESSEKSSVDYTKGWDPAIDSEIRRSLGGNGLPYFDLPGEITIIHVDKTVDTNAHMLMDNKEVPFFKIPRTYTSISTNENIEDFIFDEDSNSYFKKSEIQNYKDLVELYTAKKGKILFNTNTRLCRN